MLIMQDPHIFVLGSQPTQIVFKQPPDFCQIIELLCILYYPVDLTSEIIYFEK